MKDFMVFCYLAVQANAISQPWNWGDFLKTAAENVVFAFEKSDATERWGSPGGRNLRFVGEQIYRSSIQSQETSNAHNDALELIEECREPSNDVYNAMGGRAVWDKFLRDLSNSSRFRM